MGKFRILKSCPTENKTIRFPYDLVEQVEHEIAAHKRNCTFSAFVIQAVRHAIEELHAEEEEK